MLNLGLLLLLLLSKGTRVLWSRRQLPQILGNKCGSFGCIDLNRQGAGRSSRRLRQEGSGRRNAYKRTKSGKTHLGGNDDASSKNIWNSRIVIEFGGRTRDILRHKANCILRKSRDQYCCKKRNRLTFSANDIAAIMSTKLLFLLFAQVSKVETPTISSYSVKDYKVMYFLL